MSKTIGHRLFRLGRVPQRWRRELAAEGIRVIDEGIRCTVTYRNYRAPGRYYGWRRSMGAGAIVLTDKRLMVFYYCWPVLKIELEDPRLVSIDLSMPSPDRIVLSWDASKLYADRSGRMTIGLRTAEAANLQAWLRR